MGLDGISINQLRVTPENNSAELNSNVKFSLNPETKVVDGLAEGQKVDPDKGKEQEKPDLEEQFVESDDEQDEEPEQVEIIKYDLSDSNKYSLQLDEESNNILIIDKTSSNVVQQINADELSSYVGFLVNSQGSLISRKI